MLVMLQRAHILLAKDIVAAPSDLRHAGLDPQPPAQAYALMRCYHHPHDRTPMLRCLRSSTKNKPKFY